MEGNGSEQGTPNDPRVVYKTLIRDPRTVEVPPATTARNQYTTRICGASRRKAIKKGKGNKAVGWDGIHTEMMQTEPDVCYRILAK